MTNGLSPSLSIELGQSVSLPELVFTPATALMFENRDGHLVDEWTDAGVTNIHGDVALLCYWLDEKIIRTPKPVRIAQIYEEYSDQPGEKITDLVLVRPRFLDAEPVATMISRAVAVTGVRHVRLVTDQADSLVFRDLGVLLNNSPVEAIHLTTASLTSLARRPFNARRTAVVEQLPRDTWMPETIRHRVFRSPPEPNETSDADMRLL